VRVPRRGTAARDHDEPLGVEVAVSPGPGEKRDPVQQLEPGLRQPGAEHDRTAAAAQQRDQLPDFVRLLDVPARQLLRRVARTSQFGRERRARLIIEIAGPLAEGPGGELLEIDEDPAARRTIVFPHPVAHVLAPQLGAGVERQHAGHRHQRQAPHQTREEGARAPQHRRGRDALERVGETRRRRLVEAERPDEARGKRLGLRIAAALARQRVRQQGNVLVEAARDPQQSPVDGLQVVEVDRPFLVVERDFRHDHRVHGLPDAGGFEEGAGIQPHHAGAVIHRVEIVVLRLRIHRVRAPERQVPVAGHVRVAPLVEPGGVRADEETDVLQLRRGARADRLNPVADECGLVGRPAEERRADVEHERTIGTEADTLTERLARTRGAASPPMVVALGAGDVHALGRDAVHLHRLALLDLVPHQHRVGMLPQQRLARQVIPTSDRQHRPQPECARRGEVIELG